MASIHVQAGHADRTKTQVECVAIYIKYTLVVAAVDGHYISTNIRYMYTHTCTHIHTHIHTHLIGFRFNLRELRVGCREV